VIVLEDDILTSKYFLRFMNDALDVYSDDEKVAALGACNFFIKHAVVDDTFFVQMPDTWGWATWKRSWALFNPDAKELICQLRHKGLMDKFNLFGSYDYESMLINQSLGRISSWGIRWQASVLLNDKLVLYPTFSLTTNIGFDGSGTHCGDVNEFKVDELANRPLKVSKMIPQVKEMVVKEMIDYFTSLATPRRKSIRNVIAKFINRLTNFNSQIIH
jgi:hypothetical protein